MLTVLRIVQGVGGLPSPSLDRVPVRGAVVDSRLAGVGDLFVAIKGERSDGHVYVADAFSRGAVAALVEQDLEIPGATVVDARAGASIRDGGGPPFLIRVDNTIDALQSAGAAWRAQFSPRVVGVTGSLGKSTTKELIAQVLSARFRTLKNEGNQNNELGIPMTLLRLRPEHAYAVIEIGMYARGEIARFSSWARPHIGVVTMVKVVTNFRYQWTQLLVTIYQHQKLYLLKTYGILMAYLLGSFGQYRTLIYLARIKLI